MAARGESSGFYYHLWGFARFLWLHHRMATLTINLNSDLLCRMTSITVEALNASGRQCSAGGRRRDVLDFVPKFHIPEDRVLTPMRIVAGFAALGFLIGNLLALTDEKLVGSVIALSFTFVGGSVLTFLHKMNPEDRRIAGGAICALSVACLFGVYGGLVVIKSGRLTPSAENNTKLLRSGATSCAASIDQLRANGLPISDAYQKLYVFATTGDCDIQTSKDSGGHQ